MKRRWTRLFFSLYCPAAVRFEGGKMAEFTLFVVGAETIKRGPLRFFFYSLLSEIGENKQCSLMCKELRFYLRKKKKKTRCCSAAASRRFFAVIGSRCPCVSSLGPVILNHFLAVEKEERPMIASVAFWTWTSPSSFLVSSSHVTVAREEEEEEDSSESWWLVTEGSDTLKLLNKL